MFTPATLNLKFTEDNPDTVKVRDFLQEWQDLLMNNYVFDVPAVVFHGVFLKEYERLIGDGYDALRLYFDGPLFADSNNALSIEIAYNYGWII